MSAQGGAHGVADDENLVGVSAQLLQRLLHLGQPLAAGDPVQLVGKLAVAGKQRAETAYAVPLQIG